MNLTPSWAVGGIMLTERPYSVDRDNSVDVGEPEAVIGSQASLGPDGDSEVIEGYGNRTYSLTVYVEGDSPADLAEAEAALRAALARPGAELVVDPGDGFSPPSAFRVRVAQMRQDRTDPMEVACQHKWVLTLKCSPFARSLSVVTVEALGPPPVTPSSATIADCDTTTGWSATLYTLTMGGTVSAPVTVTDGGAYVSAAGSGAAARLVMFLSVSPVSTAAKPYVTVTVSGSTPRYFALDLDGVQVSVTPDLVMALPTGATVYAFKTAGGSLSGLTLAAGGLSQTDPFSTVYPGMSVHDVSMQNGLPLITGRQRVRTIEVDGTERTPASIEIVSPSADLGDTIVSTWTDNRGGFAPPLRRWRSNGNTQVVDVATISGYREAIGPTAVGFGVPAKSIPPGAYQIVARLRTTGATGSLNVYWEAGTSVQGVMLAGMRSGSWDVSFPVVNVWKVVPLGFLSLPVIAAANGDLSIGINHAGSSQVEYDDIWLCPVGEGCALTVVKAGATRMWLDSPSQDRETQQVRIGNTADRSNERSPGADVVAMDGHVLTPPSASIFVGSQADDVSVSASFSWRWHSNAPK